MWVEFVGGSLTLARPSGFSPLQDYTVHILQFSPQKPTSQYRMVDKEPLFGCATANVILVYYYYFVHIFIIHYFIIYFIVNSTTHGSK